MKFLRIYWSLIVLLCCLALALIFGNDADVRISLILVILIFFGFIFLIQWLIERKRNVQLEKANIENELHFLKSQIDPHFYFNTLNNLYGLASTQSDKTADVIMKLSEVMRYVIYKGKEHFVTLKEEIDYLENYIELQKLRIHKAFEINFDKDIENIEYPIAPLLLSVPIENAFKHGVDSLLNGAKISISLIQIKNNLILEVNNNFDLEEVSTEKGIGFQNLEKRLDLIYRDNYVLETKKQQNNFRFYLKIRQ